MSDPPSEDTNPRGRTTQPLEKMPTNIAVGLAIRTGLLADGLVT